MKIFISKSVEQKMAPTDLFTVLCKESPKLFSNRKATPDCVGHYLPANTPVHKTYRNNNAVTVYRFRLPQEDAVFVWAKIKYAVAAAAKTLGIEVKKIKQIANGEAGVSIDIDAGPGECVISHRRFTA